MKPNRFWDKFWSTQDEIDFLARLGEHAPGSLSREECLRRYRVAMKNRKKWGVVNRKKVEEFLREERRQR